MKENNLHDLLDLKNNVIVTQTKRIRMLEEKLADVRHKYFRLKYDDEKVESHLQMIRKY